LFFSGFSCVFFHGFGGSQLILLSFFSRAMAFIKIRPGFIGKNLRADRTPAPWLTFQPQSDNRTVFVMQCIRFIVKTMQFRLARIVRNVIHLFSDFNQRSGADRRFGAFVFRDAK
jgi:hypothetical protein